MNHDIREEAILTDRTERYWYALYTRPRFEKKIHAELSLKGLESFLPLRSTIRMWSDRRKRVEEPLFPSYVFVNANLKERYDSLQTHGVVRMVCFNGQPARIPEEQVESIHRILERGYVPEPYQYLQHGDEVEVTAGALQGLRGFYIQDRGRDRLVISVDAIRQSVAIEVERGLVRRVHEAKTVVKPKRKNFRWDLL